MLCYANLVKSMLYYYLKGDNGLNNEKLPKHVLVRLDEISNSTYPRDYLLTPELAYNLADLTRIIKKEIAVYIDRKGKVQEVMIGDKDVVPLKKMTFRRSESRLAGIRCIHTHPSGNSTLSDPDLSCLREYKLDAMIAIGEKEGKVSGISIAFLERDSTTQDTVAITYGPIMPKDLCHISFSRIINEIDKKITEKQPTKSNERTLLIGFKKNKGSLLSSEESLNELIELTKTAGGEVVNCILLRNENNNRGLKIGKGKMKEIQLFCQNQAIDLIILDDELSPKQQILMEETINCRVLDRTALILQIFADRAKTKEGKLQVELAQLNYMLPRLIGFGTSLSRLGGGIGTRGPGETKLEVDKRRIRKKITDLKREIENIKKQRNVLRKKRNVNEVPVVALVGYTNAGKSTLLNSLTNANVFAEDKLFATLDPTTRAFTLENRDILITDTVGFIHNLPHQLIMSFHATLEEVSHADLLLHVVDGSNKSFEAHIEAVNEVLEQLECLHKPTIMVFNKYDMIDDPIELQNTLSKYSPAVLLSALKKDNISDLLSAINDNLPTNQKEINYIIPYKSTKALHVIHEKGKVIKESFAEDGIHIKAILNNYWLKKVEEILKLE